VSDWIEFDSPHGVVSGYLATPRRDAGPTPGVLVLQELCGVDTHITEVADRFASAGYVALAPDLYAVGGPRAVAISPSRVEEAEEFLNGATGQFGALLGLLVSSKRRQQAGASAEVDETVEVLVATANLTRHGVVVHAAYEALRAQPRCAGMPVAAVGFCMGGALAAGLACDEPALAAAVIYYGNSPAPERVASIRCPVRGFYGSDDPKVVEGLPDFEAALTEAGIDHELRVYPGTLHAFANDTRPWYSPGPARDAWSRTLAFLANTLTPPPSTVLS